MKNRDFKILIVEDDPGMRKFLGDFCIVNGYRAEFACNGSDALTRMKQNGSYDLIIADFLMPEMNGEEFIRRAKEKWINLPIIAMSAWEDVENSLIKAGAYMFLRKPFDPYVLEREIELLSKKKAALSSLNAI